MIKTPSCSCWIGRAQTFGSSIERERCAKHGITAGRAKALAETLCRVMVDDDTFCWTDGGRDTIEAILAKALAEYAS